MFALKILCLYPCFSFCALGIDIQLKYCKFQCGNSCEKATSYPPVGISRNSRNILHPYDLPEDVNPPKAVYYWRDFHGRVPPDAFPLGSATQFPQTFIGLAYDPSHRGTFGATIYDGLDYVYSTNEGDSTKITKNIQILCSRSSKDLAWFKLTDENYNDITREGYRVVQAYFHEEVDVNARRHYHYIARTKKCNVNYAGVVGQVNANGSLEYSLIDGTYQSTMDFQNLMFKKPSRRTKRTVAKKEKAFGQQFTNETKPDSTIPAISRNLTIGSCTASCSIKGQNSIGLMDNTVKFSSSIAYYWQPEGMVYEDEALAGGADKKNKVLYIGQSTVFRHIFLDVGPSDTESVTIYYDKAIQLSSDFHVLSTKQPEKFKWVNTTSENFSKLNTDKLIPGGVFNNGTATYVCRFLPNKSSLLEIGSGRVLTKGTFCYTVSGRKNKFQVLMFE